MKSPNTLIASLVFASLGMAMNVHAVLAPASMEILAKAPNLEQTAPFEAQEVQRTQRLEGVIIAIDKRNNTARIRPESGSEAVEITLPETVKVSGLRSGGISSLQPGDEVVLTFTKM